MVSWDRRTFIGSAASLAASLAPQWLSGQTQGDAKPTNLAPLADDAPFQPSTLFLTWQRDPTTTMTVQWVGALGETADTRIHYGRVGDAVQLIAPTAAKPYPKTDLKVFRAELAGLMPGTDYQFRIGKASPAYRFYTMPGKATDTIHFISGGDVGINQHAVANNIQAARQNPMFAIVGGDLGYDNGRSVEVSLAFLRNYSRHMIGRDGRLIPMLACIGNHEVDGGYAQPRAKAPFFYALFDGLFRDTSYATLDFGDYLSLLLLDSGHTSAIGGDQADWLERRLRERTDHPHVLAINHVPAYPSARKMEGEGGKAGTGADQRKFWTPLFDRFRVPVVLEHHDHTFKRTKPLLDGRPHQDGVLYLGDGSWGRIRTPQPREKLPFLAALSKEYHLSLHRLQCDERFHLALDEHGRVIDVCRSAQRPRGIVSVRG